MMGETGISFRLPLNISSDYLRDLPQAPHITVFLSWHLICQPFQNSPPQYILIFSFRYKVIPFREFYTDFPRFDIRQSGKSLEYSIYVIDDNGLAFLDPL